MFNYLKQAYQSVSRGFAKVSAWTLQSLRILLVLTVLFYTTAMVWLLYFADKVKVDAHSVLVLTLKGPLVEESADGWRDRAMGELQGASGEAVRLRDLARALDLAGNDKRIERVLLKLDDFKGGGLASLREAALAIDRFKAYGKPVIAWSASYDQRQYYLAAHASQVVLHPLGGVSIEGLGGQRNYYREALDKLGIQANLIRVGQYKSAGEPFVLNAPSKPALAAEAYVLDALWGLYTTGVEKARKLPAGSIAKNIDTLPGALQQTKGDAAQLAKDWHWVDRLQTFEAVAETFKNEVGEDEDSHSFRQVGYKDYLQSARQAIKGAHIAVIVAQGEIVDGEASLGKVGGLSTADLVRQATQDETVKAIVLRVNSPGGSVLGSELIRDQLRLARERGKPVVVSMGDVAASGGYWISMASDMVVADPATVTGSIGVFSMLPTGSGLMGKIGIHTGGYRTTWLAGAYDPRLALDPRIQALAQTSVEHFYSDFISKVAQTRQLEPARVNELAQGRIWTGAQAYDRKLVDRLGGFDDAVDQARKLVAKRQVTEPLPGTSLPIVYMGPKLSALDAFVQKFLPQRGKTLEPWGALAPLDRLARAGAGDAALLGALGDDLQWLQGVLNQRQPFGAVAHCLCQVRP